MTLGILFSLGALVCWAFGDFFSQRTTRKIGNVQTLFFSTFFGFLVLTPFTISQAKFAENISANILLLLLTAVIALFSALFNLEAFKRGKMSVVEPILGFELPLTVLFSVILLNEVILLDQWVVIALIFIGIILTSAKKINFFDKKVLEKGALLAMVGALGLAMSNFMVGVTSRQVTALVAFWSVQVILMISSFIILAWRKDLHSLIPVFKKNYLLIFALATFNNLGWLSFAYAVHFAPLAIVIAISEAYIALATLLGILINRERLTRYQVIGVSLAIAGVIILAVISQ